LMAEVVPPADSLTASLMGLRDYRVAER
jgi:hypothetical protein